MSTGTRRYAFADVVALDLNVFGIVSALSSIEGSFVHQSSSHRYLNRLLRLAPTEQRLQLSCDDAEPSRSRQRRLATLYLQIAPASGSERIGLPKKARRRRALAPVARGTAGPCAADCTPPPPHCERLLAASERGRGRSAWGSWAHAGELTRLAAASLPAPADRRSSSSR